MPALVEHASGLGSQRWVVERTLSWLHQYRRLRVRYERRAPGNYKAHFVRRFKYGRNRGRRPARLCSRRGAT